MPASSGSGGVGLPDAVNLVRSKQRVADHGEVFTPEWLVEDMLDLVKDESERIDARFLEPACGSGNFLVPVLLRKLATVETRYRRSDFERRHHALLALMSIYGIELLADNVAACRTNLLMIFADYLGVDAESEWCRAARAILDVNIVHGDALRMTDARGNAITFAEWAYLGAGRFQRRDFHFRDLAQRSSFEGTLWERPETHAVFMPAKDYPPLTVGDLA